MLSTQLFKPASVIASPCTQTRRWSMTASWGYGGGAEADHSPSSPAFRSCAWHRGQSKRQNDAEACRDACHHGFTGPGIEIGKEGITSHGEWRGALSRSHKPDLGLSMMETPRLQPLMILILHLLQSRGPADRIKSNQIKWVTQQQVALSTQCGEQAHRGVTCAVAR